MKEKSLFVNYIFSALYTSLNLVFPLITMPYVSRILLAEGVGAVSFAQNIVQYFVLFASLGIPNYGIREIAKVRDDNHKMNGVFTEIFCINFISTLISSICFILVISFIPNINNKVLFWASGVSLCFNMFNVDWFYKGIEEYKYITVRSFFIKLISLSAIFVFVRTKEDCVVYALIHSLAEVGNYLFNVLHLRKYVRLNFEDFFLKPHLTPIVVMLSTQIAVNLYAQVDTTMLGFLSGDVYVGYYSNVIKMVRLIVNLTTTLSVILLPRLSYYLSIGKEKELNILVNRALKVIMYLCIPSAVGIFILSPQIVRVVLGDNFIPSIPTLRILAFQIVILAVGNLFGSQLLIIYGQEKKLLFSTVLGAITNILLNSFMIRLYQQNGAAIASVVAEFVVMTTQIRLALKYCKVRLDIRFVGKILGSIFMMIGGILLLDKLILAEIEELVLKVFCGVVLYFISGVYLKNEVSLLIMKKIRRWFYGNK